jgi:MinD superfamily P-loop ATPase
LFVQGRVSVGEAMSRQVIRLLIVMINRDKLFILDAPPGASCPVIHTVIGSDFIILVTEPTPFGLHDLKIAVEALSPLEIPCGVILNRADLGDRKVQEFCGEVGIPVLAEIPHSRRIAEGYANGNLLVVQEPDYIKTFLHFFSRISQMVAERASHGKEVAL